MGLVEAIRALELEEWGLDAPVGRRMAEEAGAGPRLLIWGIE